MAHALLRAASTLQSTPCRSLGEGTRVSLDSVVIHFQEGASPEAIIQSFPTLKLSQAVAYYLENESAINEYIANGQHKLEQSVPPLSQSNPEIFARLEATRLQIGSKRGLLSAS